MARQRKAFLKHIWKAVVIDENTTRPSSFVEGIHKSAFYRDDTDKFQTGLFQEYMAVFKDIQLKPVTLLEIGVCMGGSMFLWADFFKNRDSKAIAGN